MSKIRNFVKTLSIKTEMPLLKTLNRKKIIIFYPLESPDDLFLLTLSLILTKKRVTTLNNPLFI